MIPFSVSGVSAGFHIRTHTDEDRERLPCYEATSKLPWDPSIATRAGNEKAEKSNSTYDKAKPHRDDRIFNLSTLWCRDFTELIQLYQEDSLYEDNDEDQTD